VILAGFRYVQRFRVPFSDVDMLRHVNNLAYLRWAEQIRSEYFAEVLGSDITSEWGMIMATLNVVYEQPVQYRERVAIGCKIDRIGTKSFDFAYEIWSDDRALRCVRVSSTMVAMDYKRQQTITVPDDWRAKIAAFEASAAGV
jgi:acyl-CoA thioester hydrolase